MKVAVVVSSRKGGVHLSPSNFGEKIEFIARKCGEFKEGEVVVALASVHDTKPETPRRGARFVQVRHLGDVDVSELVKLGWTSTHKVAAGTEEGELMLEDVTHLHIRYDSWGELNGPELFRKRRKIKKDDLMLQVDRWIDDKGHSSIRLWEGKDVGSKTWIGVPDELARGILEQVFGHDVVAEEEKLRREREERAAARAKEEAEAAAKWKVEEQRRIELLFSVYPEARGWFKSPPTWENVGDEMLRRKIAVYSGQEKTGHYASFSKEMDFYSYFWKFTLGDETFTISRSTVDHIYGDD
ncbi:MAG: hypothetical protein Q7S52_00865 [bacterium]|nr:hypothetical protein [bacterium]